VKQSFTGVSIAEFRIAGATLYSSSNSDDEGINNKASSYPDNLGKKKYNYTISPKDQLQQIATLEQQKRDWELEIEEKLKLQRQELENKHHLEVTQLKLTLASTREELNEVEDKAKTFDATSKDFQQKLAQAIEDKGAQLEKLEKDWTNKYTLQTQSLNREKLDLKQQLEQQKRKSNSSIVNLKNEITMIENKVKEFKEKTIQLEERNAAEIENKKTALMKLDRDLTEKFEAEANELREWGTQNKKTLDEYTKYAEAEISKLKSQSQEQKGVLSRKLFMTRRNNGKLRKELNKVKQSALLDMRKLKNSYEILEQERDDALEQAAMQKASNLQLLQDMKNVRNDSKELQKQAAKDLSNWRNEWKERLRVRMEEAEKEKEEIIAERNQAVVECYRAEKEKKEIMVQRNHEVLERDTIIQEYEDELASIRRMLKQCINILKSRSRKRYERLEIRLPVLRSTRLKVFGLSKRGIQREEEKSRIAFVKPITQQTVRKLKRKDKQSH